MINHSEEDITMIDPNLQDLNMMDLENQEEHSEDKEEETEEAKIIEVEILNNKVNDLIWLFKFKKNIQIMDYDLNLFSY